MCVAVPCPASASREEARGAFLAGRRAARGTPPALGKPLTRFPKIGIKNYSVTRRGVCVYVSFVFVFLIWECIYNLTKELGRISF